MVSIHSSKLCPWNTLLIRLHITSLGFQIRGWEIGFVPGSVQSATPTVVIVWILITGTSAPTHLFQEPSGHSQYCSLLHFSHSCEIPWILHLVLVKNVAPVSSPLFLPQINNSLHPLVQRWLHWSPNLCLSLCSLPFPLCRWLALLQKYLYHLARWLQTLLWLPVAYRLLLSIQTLFDSAPVHLVLQSPLCCSSPLLTGSSGICLHLLSGRTCRLCWASHSLCWTASLSTWAGSRVSSILYCSSYL